MVKENPRRFHFVAEGLHRAPLKSFPYHFLYEERNALVRFLVLRLTFPYFEVNRP